VFAANPVQAVFVPRAMWAATVAPLLFAKSKLPTPTAFAVVKFMVKVVRGFEKPAPSSIFRVKLPNPSTEPEVVSRVHGENEQVPKVMAPVAEVLKLRSNIFPSPNTKPFNRVATACQLVKVGPAPMPVMTTVA
jgi:hypothetical protein